MRAVSDESGFERRFQRQADALLRPFLPIIVTGLLLPPGPAAEWFGTVLWPCRLCCIKTASLLPQKAGSLADCASCSDVTSARPTEQFPKRARISVADWSSSKKLRRRARRKPEDKSRTLATIHARTRRAAASLERSEFEEVLWKRRWSMLEG